MVHLKRMWFLKIVRLGRWCFQPAVCSSSVYHWPSCAEPDVNSDKLWQRGCVVPSGQHEFHPPCPQAGTGMLLHVEAKGFIQNWHMQRNVPIALGNGTKQRARYPQAALLALSSRFWFLLTLARSKPEAWRCSTCCKHLLRKDQYQSFTGYGGVEFCLWTSINRTLLSSYVLNQE